MSSKRHPPDHRHDRRRARNRADQPRRHTALWRSHACTGCGAAVRVAEEDTGDGRLRGSLIDRDPDPRGVLVRRSDGYLQRDPRREADGPRYTWHNCPARNPPG